MTVPTMTRLTGAERAAYVQSMFARIARRYDLMNRLMTGGQDVGWRREVIRLAQPPPGGTLLDLGTGTGDMNVASRVPVACASRSWAAKLARLTVTQSVRAMPMSRKASRFPP